MVEYDKLVIISGNRYEVRTDRITDLATLFSRVFDVNTIIILVLKHGTDIHTVDIGKVILNDIEWLLYEDIYAFIQQLTPEMIYTFRTELFQQMRCIRSFMSHDVPGGVMISPCNETTGELSQTTFDPMYQDMVITANEYDFDKVIPIIDGKLRYCSWSNKNIYLKDRVDLVKQTKEITFLSFGDTSVSLRSLQDIKSNQWNIPENHVVILVLNGAFFYDIPYMFTVDRQQHILRLNERFVQHEFKKRGFDTIDTLIADKDSFAILVETDRVLVRDVLMIPVTKYREVHQFVYYENVVQRYHVDYVCIDNQDSTVRGITVADERYKNVVTKKLPVEHHVYTHGGSGDMRLIQLSVC